MSAIWKIEKGQIVEFRQEVYEITQILDLGTVLGKNLQTGEYEKLIVSELNPYLKNGESSIQKNDPNSDEANTAETETDLGSVISEKWDEAIRRSEVVKELLQQTKITVDDVQKQAAKLGVSRATMYRYINKYLATEKTSALIPNASDGGRGKTRIAEDSESILQKTINEFYLTKQNPKVQKVIREYKRLCYNAGVKPAHDNTVRNRIKQLDEIDSIAKRKGRSAARGYEPTPGKFPEGRFPMEVTQIDHTPIDLQFVDDEDRESVGRYWLTVLIEVFSRMILGFYISPDRPSLMSVGMCLTHAILPKEAELARLGVEGEWKTCGLMNKIHADNAGEFRGYDLKRICQEYDIDLEWRPVGKPHYGAHIERLLGTFMQEVHLLPGTTFSSIEKKGDYDSEKEAVFTYDEFVKWLTTYIVGVYHKTKHEGIGMSPETMYERGLFVGTDEFPPTGFPPRVLDERKLRIDLMPSIERTVQQNGVEIDLINYYDPVLSPFIGTKDPQNRKLTRKFIFKRNPRNLQKIYFYHPDLRRYFEIPYRNLANPDMTIWELKAARQKLKDAGEKIKSEDQIFKALNEMRDIQNNSVEKTKKARREEQNRRIYEKQKLPSDTRKSDLQKSQKDKNISPESTTPAYRTGLSDFFNISENEVTPLKVEE